MFFFKHDEKSKTSFVFKEIFFFTVIRGWFEAMYYFKSVYKLKKIKIEFSGQTREP